MLALKIIGISLAAIFGLILLLLIIVPLLRLKLQLTCGGDGIFAYKIKVMCFSFKLGKQKKKKKQSKIALKIKKAFGLDVFDKQEGEKASISEKVATAVGLITVFAEQIKFLFGKIRLDRLWAFVVCGDGDAADAAMDYGLACASVYPLAGYLEANINAKKNGIRVNIGCDFENESKIEFDIILSVRIYYLLSALVTAMRDMTEITENSTEVNDE